MLKRFVAVVAALDRLAYLMIGQFEFRPHLHALRLGAFPAFAGAGADQVALELCQPAQHGQEPCPLKTERFKAAKLPPRKSLKTSRPGSVKGCGHNSSH